MKKFLRTFITALTILCMAVPAAEAQRHHGARNDRPGRETPSRGHGGSRPGASRPASNSRPSSGSRPSNNSNHGNTGGRPGSSRPGNNGNHGNHNPGNHNPGRPGNNGGNHGNHNPGNHNPGRPGNNGGNHGNHNPGNHNPGYGHPGHHHRPDHGGRPGIGNHRPGPRPPMVRPPYRPYRPHIARPHYRPVPPPAWRPAHRVPFVRGILGITFGTAFNVSLDYLYSNGYTVDGYGNNIVYLRNVPMLNMVWTDGALYYGNAGLDLSSFYYSTPVYDMARYNNSYNVLVNTYGSPYEVTNVGGTITSTWFAGGNSFITLSFGANNGRYLTTLSLGL